MKSLEELAGRDAAMRGCEFAALIRTLMLAKGELGDAGAIARRNHAPPRVQDAIRTKATVGVGGASSSDWGRELAEYRVLASGFQDQLRWSSVFYRMLPDMVRLPFGTIVGAVYGGAATTTVDRSVAIPVTKFDVSQASELTRLKTASLLSATRELLETGVGIEGLLTRSLRALVTSAVDAAFLDALATGAPTSAATASVETDLETMRASVAPTDQSRLFWLTTPVVASRLAGLTATGAYRYPSVTWSGGTLKGAPLLVSDQVDVDVLVLVDASRVAAAADPIELDTSDQATLEAVDNPGVGSPQGVGIGTTALLSTWQEDLRTVRVIAYWAAQKIRYNAAYFLTAINWAST